MNEIRDSGHGVTVKSLELWNARKQDIGRVTRIRADKDYVIRTPDPEVPMFDLSPEPAGMLEYSLVIYGENGTMYLSGCNCGYGGEGPNGTRKILEELGVPGYLAQKLVMQPQIDARL